MQAQGEENNYAQPTHNPMIRRAAHCARFIVQKRNASDKLLPAMGPANCSPVCLLLEGNDRRRLESVASVLMDRRVLVELRECTYPSSFVSFFSLCT